MVTFRPLTQNFGRCGRVRKKKLFKYSYSAEKSYQNVELFFLGFETV